MTQRRLLTDYLRDIVEYSDKATRFVQGLDFETFRKDEQKTLAVVRALEVIGEAARHIPKTLRDKYPTEESIATCTVRPHLYKSSVSTNALPSYPSWSNWAQVFRLDAGADTVG